jgi:hypothetical protein
VSDTPERGIRARPVEPLALSSAPLPVLGPGEAEGLPVLTARLAGSVHDDDTLPLSIELVRTPGVAGVEVVESDSTVTVRVRGHRSDIDPSTPVTAVLLIRLASVRLPHPLAGRELIVATTG